MLPRVLLLDPLFGDEREIYGLFLRRHGYEVTVCADAEVAIESARAKNVGVVVTRVLQPSGIDGIDLTRRLKQDAHTGDIPVIIISTLIASEIRSAAREAGCDCFLMLPCTPQQLAIEIDAAIDRRRSVSNPRPSARRRRRTRVASGKAAGASLA